MRYTDRPISDAEAQKLVDLLAVRLTGRGTAPLTLVLAGDGAHLLATRDYGLTADYDGGKRKDGDGKGDGKRCNIAL
jgi:hypothetical protein